MGTKNFAFIQKIKRLRDEQGIKQSEIAAYLGVSPKVIRLMKMGESLTMKNWSSCPHFMMFPSTISWAYRMFRKRRLTKSWPQKTSI